MNRRHVFICIMILFLFLLAACTQSEQPNGHLKHHLSDFTDLKPGIPLDNQEDVLDRIGSPDRVLDNVFCHSVYQLDDDWSIHIGISHGFICFYYIQNDKLSLCFDLDYLGEPGTDIEEFYYKKP